MTDYYIIIAVGAYSLFAINGVIDKFLLTKAVKHPVAYAFFIGITGPLTLFLAPFGLKLVNGPDFLIALVGGASFVFALYFHYIAEQKTSISRILPIEGGLVPVFTLLLAYFLLQERLSHYQLIAFVLLVIGAVLISLKEDTTGWHPKALGYALIAAFFFSLSFTLTKYIFAKTNFVSGLIWTRLGFFVAAIMYLIPPKNRQYIFNAPKETSNPNKLLYLGGRASGGLAGLLQNYAISLGSVTIVNAMQGSQYALLLILTLVLSKFHPKVLKENISLGRLIQKGLAIILISIGLAILSAK